MSVILRRHNRIVLYCKGADNVIYDRLGPNQNDLKNKTQEHLNVGSKEKKNLFQINFSCDNNLLSEIRKRRSTNSSIS